jgi:DNA-binding YbaB/EbfC family protein
MMDMTKMFGKMKEMQTKLKEAQDNLESISATGESGGGMVKATVNGKKKVIALEIEDDLIKKDEKEMLGDLILAAINIAMDEIEGKINEEMRKTTEGMIPNIPGMDFSKMFS